LIKFINIYKDSFDLRIDEILFFLIIKDIQNIGRSIPKGKASRKNIAST